MTSVNSAFKAYDIRGTVPEQLNNYFFKKLAISIEHWLRDEFSIKSPKVGVINDMRQDSRDFALSFLSGLRVSDATYFGMLPTDAAYFALNKYDLDLICIITASHNPQNYNGAKIFRKDFKTGGVIPITAESGLIEIAKLFSEYEPDSQNNEKPKTNKFTEINILEEYSKYVLSFFDKDPKRLLNVGIDYGNGVAGIIDDYLYKAPINRTSIYKEPDGSFPNHIANPALPESLKDLQDLVVNNRLDVGLAFDGDGDRLGIIDEKGNVVDGNQVGILLIRQLLPNLNNKTVVLAITSSKNLEDEIDRLGGNVVYTKQGRFVPEKMKEIGAEIGLEPSCHYYLSCNFGLDSGLIAAVIVLNLLAGSSSTISKMLELNNNWLSSGELNFSVTDVDKVIEAVSSQFLEFNIDRLDGIRINSESFWISLRSSNTEPLIRLNIESKSKEELDNLLKTVTKIIKSNEA